MTQKAQGGRTDVQFTSLSSLLHPADSFSDMCAEDVEFEAPYAPAGANRIVGRQYVANYMPVVPDFFTIEELVETAQYRCTDPELAILEFYASNGVGVKTGLPYDQKYINVIRVRDGNIVQYRDYWNPSVVLDAVGGVDALPDNVKTTA